MRDPIESILNTLDRDTAGLVIVWSPLDVGIREWLVSQVESLAPHRHPVRVASVDEALCAPDQLALLVPGNEREVVEDLDASRERIRSEEAPRTQPIALFLFRDGEGQKALARAVSLQSFCRGNDPDPEALAEVDVPEERARFQARTGQAPEPWLASWDEGSIERTAESYALASWAKLLVQP
jgi:hypothetical protein